MTARKDKVAKETSRRKPREFGQGRFGGRYHPTKAGAGHSLSLPETGALIAEQLNDYVKPGINMKRATANVILTEAAEPPEEIRRAFMAAVEGMPGASHMWDGVKMYHSIYAKLQWGIDLQHGHGD